MIRGYFTGTHTPRALPYIPIHPPVPKLDATIWIPELGLEDDPRAATLVSFLADTGADMTVLHPEDSKRLFVNQAQWNWLTEHPSITFGGAGQLRQHYQVSAYVILRHTDQSVDYRPLTLYVPEPHPGIAEIESLLGRDVLGHYRALFDRNITLTLETSAPPDPATSAGTPP